MDAGVVVENENGSINGEVAFGSRDCDAESNKCALRSSSVNTSIAVVSVASFDAIPLL